MKEQQRRCMWIIVFSVTVAMITEFLEFAAMVTINIQEKLNMYSKYLFSIHFDWFVDICCYSKRFFRN